MITKEDSLTSKTIKSISGQTFVTIGMAVLSLVVFAIMSRLLTKEEFGKYAALTAITSIFAALAEAGLGSALIQYKNSSREYVSTAFNLSWIIGFIITLILFVCARPLAIWIVDESLTLPLQILAISVFFNGLAGVVKSHMTRQLQFVKMGYYSAVTYVISAGIAIYLAYVGYGVYAVVIEQVLFAILTFLVFYFTLPEKPSWFYISREYCRQILVYGGWLTASVIFRVVYQQMDKLLMSRWLSVSLLGAYNRPAGFIANISSRIDNILDTVLFPILSSIQEEKERVARAYDKIIYLCGLYAGILCITMLYASNLLIDVFFGAEWRSIAVVFCILVFSMLFNVIGRIMDCFIRSLAYVKMGFYMRVLACFITFGSLFCGKDYGIEGVAIAVVISKLLITYIKVFYINYKIEIPFLHTISIILKSQSIILIPLIIFIIGGTTFITSTVGSLLSLLGLGIYFIILFYSFPNLLGEYLKDFVQKKLKVKF